MTQGGRVWGLRACLDASCFHSLVSIQAFRKQLTVSPPAETKGVPSVQWRNQLRQRSKHIKGSKEGYLLGCEPVWPSGKAVGW